MDRAGSDSEDEKRSRERSRSRRRTPEGSDSEDEKRSRQRSRSRHRTPEGASKESRHREKKEPRPESSLRSKKRKFKDNAKGRQYECALCDCVFYTVSQYNLHIQSFEHRKRVIARRSAAAPYTVPGKRGPKTHCAICNVFLNSEKQRSEHLNGIRHKQLCFKLNVPLSSLKISADHTETLEDTRLVGSKLMCKHCSVELNSMQQYEIHMKSKNHLLRKEHKTVNHTKAVLKATKALSIKNKKKLKEETPKEDKPRDERGRETSDDESANDKGDTHELPIKVKRRKKEDDGNVSKHLLTRGHREKMRQLISGKKKDTEPEDDEGDCSENKRQKPELYCDICQSMSASKPLYDSHLQGKKHKFLAELKQKSDRPQKPSNTHKSGKQSVEAGPLKGVELYCEICQETHTSQKAFDEHIKSKKHKFLSELKPPNQKPQAQTSKGQSAAQGAERTSRVTSDDAKAKQQPSGGRSSDGRKRHRSGSGDRAERRDKQRLSTYERLVLERQKIQKELEKREKEIEEQKKLVEKLQVEKQEEKEKAVLRKMIAECRQLLEERHRKVAEMKAREEAWKRDESPSSRSSDMWNHSPPPGNEYQCVGNELQPRPREFEGPDFREGQGGQRMFFSERKSESDSQGDTLQPRFAHGSPGSHELLGDEPGRFSQRSMSPEDFNRRHRVWQNEEVRRGSESTFPISRNVPLNRIESATQGQQLRSQPVEQQSDCAESWPATNTLDKRRPSRNVQSWDDTTDMLQESFTRESEGKFSRSPAQWPNEVSVQGQPWKEHRSSQQEAEECRSNFRAAPQKRLPRETNVSSITVQQFGESSNMLYSKDEDSQQLSGTSFQPWCASQESQQLPEWSINQEVDVGSRGSDHVNDRWQHCNSSAPVLSQHGTGNLQQLSANPEQSVWQKNEDQWPPAADVTPTVPSQPARQIQPAKTFFENIDQWKPRSNLVHIQTVDIKPIQHREYSALKQVPIVESVSTGTPGHTTESCYQRQTCEQQIPVISQHGSNRSERDDNREAYDSKNMDDSFPTSQPPAPKRRALLPLPVPKETLVMQNPRDSGKLDSKVRGARDKDEKECHFISSIPVKANYAGAERQQPWYDRSALGEDLFPGMQCLPQQKEPTLALRAPRESYTKEDPWSSRNVPLLDSKTGYARVKQEDKYEAKPPAGTSNAATSSETHPGWSRQGVRSGDRSPHEDPGSHPAQHIARSGGSVHTSYQDWPLAGGTESTRSDSRWGHGPQGDSSRFGSVREPDDKPSWSVSESNMPAYSHEDRQGWTESSSGMHWDRSSNKEKGFDTKWEFSGRQSAGKEQSPDGAKTSTTSLWGVGSNEGTVRIPGFDYV
ncbi:trichohyalin-like isoform X2 [Ornithodoros turicata]|uniref:trichohyalin-like isoform X2 n=1 Tax=Ornithodoros turicata TaxID=34597 RepID=UPI0031390EB9